MSCIVSDCSCEGRGRTNWPMPESPLPFFGPETWLDDDALDRAAIAHRLGASEFTTDDVADALGICRQTMERMKRDGRLFPTRYEHVPWAEGFVRAIYSAERTAGEVLRRGVSV